MNIEEIKTYVRVIKAGGIIIFPTSTVYGLAGDATRYDVIKKIFLIKNRPLHKPISILISKINQLTNVACFVPQNIVDLMESFWPGKVTFIVKAHKNIPEILTAGTGNIGVRIPFNRTAMYITKYFDSPITATSANISGKPGATCIEEIGTRILNSVDLVINKGLLKGGVGSTIIDTTTNPLQILREGTLTKKDFFSSKSLTSGVLSCEINSVSSPEW